MLLCYASQHSKLRVAAGLYADHRRLCVICVRSSQKADCYMCMFPTRDYVTCVRSQQEAVCYRCLFSAGGSMLHGYVTRRSLYKLLHGYASYRRQYAIHPYTPPPPPPPPLPHPRRLYVTRLCTAQEIVCCMCMLPTVDCMLRVYIPHSKLFSETRPCCRTGNSLFNYVYVPPNVVLRKEPLSGGIFSLELTWILTPFP